AGDRTAGHSGPAQRQRHRDHRPLRAGDPECHGRAFIIHNGAIFRSGEPADLQADEEVRRVYLGDRYQVAALLRNRN
ncbi:MAG: hypothetical protein OXN97_12680, partial [Bryobacterales bacterium]|nr:hypothetical protein [Bryobacterales bacterium]